MIFALFIVIIGILFSLLVLFVISYGISSIFKLYPNIYSVVYTILKRVGFTDEAEKLSILLLFGIMIFILMLLVCAITKKRLYVKEDRHRAMIFGLSAMIVFYFLATYIPGLFRVYGSDAINDGIKDTTTFISLIFLVIDRV